ncbi:MAG: flagellar biosynthesis anti-sigma factor FlgM [Bacillota bacterium]|nr:flagellar biosynthesis anti-sigma factor FlgM [Bacillota bacterium]
MKIWGDIPRISGIYDKQKSTGRIEKTSGVAPKKDVVSISNNAKDFQTALKAVKDVPDMRTDKVNELSEKYEAGNYDVSGKDIADKIVTSVFNRQV